MFKLWLNRFLSKKKNHLNYMATLIDSKRLSLVKATVALKYVKVSRLLNSETRINGSKLTCFKPLICQSHQLRKIRIQKERL